MKYKVLPLKLHTKSKSCTTHCNGKSVTVRVFIHTHMSKIYNFNHM